MQDELEPQQWVRHIHGPYVAHASGRQIILITFLDGSKKTKPYARYLVEQALGRELDPVMETVDHIDRDVTNNALPNFRILPKGQHIREDVPHAHCIEVVCPQCGEMFEAPLRKMQALAREGRAGPFCGRQCAGRYSSAVQHGYRERLLPAPMLSAPSSTLRDKTVTATVADLVAALPEKPRPLWRAIPKPPKPKPRRCKICAAQLKGAQKHTCSDTCRSAYHLQQHERPTEDELRLLVWEMPTEHIASRYGVSGNAVGKWCKKFGIEKPPRGYWQKKAAGKV